MQAEHARPLTNLPSSVILVATQLLLHRFQLRLSIDSICRGTDNSDFYFATGVRGARKKLIVPHLRRNYVASILGILEWANTAQSAYWFPNGQASRGARQLEHFGDAGRCSIVWPQDLMRSHLEHTPFPRIADDMKEKMIAAHPERPLLKVDGDAILLPSIANCDVIASALQGNTLVIGAKQLAQIRPVIDAGLKLAAMANTSPPGTPDALLLARSDSTHIKAIAAELVSA